MFIIVTFFLMEGSESVAVLTAGFIWLLAYMNIVKFLSILVHKTVGSKMYVVFLYFRFISTLILFLAFIHQLFFALVFYLSF
ncbi:hypothetical protein J3Q64DRAFT_1732269 [Phycomyces blakesleeanus]|uniref:Uncharacterized protein n=1 Tax=Phycomyces blakesleeanus TaxID=4837 RepID=A0ABR3B3B5_PHYBL